MSVLCGREAEPVAIGSVTLYCESFKSTASATLYEQPTVTGGTLLTNTCVKSAKLTLMGRVYSSEAPLECVAALNNMVGSGGIDIVYRGVRFRDCILQNYTAEDKGDEMLYLTVTLATLRPAENTEVQK